MVVTSSVHHCQPVFNSSDLNEISGNWVYGYTSQSSNTIRNDQAYWGYRTSSDEDKYPI